VFTWVADKDAARGSWAEFVWRGGIKVWVPQASEHAEVSVGRVLAIKQKVWRDVIDGARGANVEEVGGSMQGFNPKGRR
jgi:hypothetical protein